MLAAVCYLAAVILLVLAAVLPAAVPYRDRLAYAGLALYVLPAAVHALNTH